MIKYLRHWFLAGSPRCSPQLSFVGVRPIHSFTVDIKSIHAQLWMALSGDRDAEGKLTVTQELPSSVCIHDGVHGRCLIATRAFAEGDTVYRSSGLLFDFPDGDLNFTLRVVDSEGAASAAFQLDGTNSVKDSDDPSSTTRQVFGWDGFMWRDGTRILAGICRGDMDDSQGSDGGRIDTAG